MKISISDLRRAAASIFDALDPGGEAQVKLDHDYYLDLSREHRYPRPESDSVEFSIEAGQLYDDLAEINEILSAKRSALPSDLEPLAALLRYLADLQGFQAKGLG